MASLYETTLQQARPPAFRGFGYSAELSTHLKNHCMNVSQFLIDDTGILTVHPALRVDWSRAKARKSRWEEEVELLRKEMRRVLRYLQWEKETWDRRGTEAAARTDVLVEKQAGLQACAAKQAAMHNELFVFFRSEMGLSLDQATTSTIALTLDEDGASNLNALFGQGEFQFFFHLFSR
jgi:hypothetical protein